MEEYKLVVLGAAGVGKTSLIQRYVHDVFDAQLPQQTMQEEEKIISYRNSEVKLKICDMAGQDVVDLMTKQFYSGTNAIIYVYDVTSEQSLFDADTWLKDLEIYLTQDLQNGIPILFVGNKSDRIAEVQQAQERLAHSERQQSPPAKSKNSKKEIDEQDAVAWATRDVSDDEQEERREIVTLKRVEAFLKALKSKKPNLIFLHPAECSAKTGQGVNEVFTMVSMFLVSDKKPTNTGFKCRLL